jgi:hypothetical protein
LESRAVQATVICVDDSEWMRNGNYPPTRLQAQEDAANLVVGTKMAVRLLASLPPLMRRWIGLDWIFFLFGWGFDLLFNLGNFSRVSLLSSPLPHLFY